MVRELLVCNVELDTTLPFVMFRLIAYSAYAAMKRLQVKRNTLNDKCMAAQRDD